MRLLSCTPMPLLVCLAILLTMLSVVKVKQSALPRIQCYVVKAKVLLSVLSVVKVSGGGGTRGEDCWEWEINCAVGVGARVERGWLGVGD